MADFPRMLLFQHALSGVVSRLLATAAAIAFLLSHGWAQGSANPEILIAEPSGSSGDGVAFSPDGKFIATGSRDKTVKLWDVSTGRPIRSFEGNKLEINVVTGTGHRFRYFEGHKIEVTTVAFSPDGKLLASGSRGKSFAKRLLTEGIRDESLAQAIDEEMPKLWEVSTGRFIRSFDGHQDYLYDLAFSPDGRFLASAGSEKTLKLWEINTGRLIRSFKGYRESVFALAFSPDGKMLVSSGYSSYDDKNRLIRLWDVNTGRLIRFFEGTRGNMFSVAFSPDGKLIASGEEGSDPKLKIWEVNTGQLFRSFEGHHDTIRSVAFSPDGSLLASGSDDKTVKLWEVSNGRLIRSFEGHKRDVHDIAFSPNGKILASKSEHTIKLWAIDNGKLLVSLIDLIDGNWIALTPDNYYVSSEGAAKYVSWRLGDKVYGENQFKSQFNKPNLVAANLIDQDATSVALSDKPEKSKPNTSSNNTVITEPPKPPIADTTAPKIIIKSPLVTKGVSVISTASTVTITGQAFDDSGVSKVVVSGTPVQLDARGNFSVDISLKIGDNQVTVTAADIHGNSAAESFSIRRDQELIMPRGNYVALVIGINVYQHLRPLKTAVNDAKAVDQVLREFYGFETTLLLNPSRNEILAIINKYRRTLNANDHLLIYYAGHGYRDNDVKKAYWQPVDALKDDNANWISADDVTTNIRGIPARHILIISDSCYSGTIASDLAVRAFDSSLSTPEDRRKRIEKMMLRTSRSLMASGGNEPVADYGNDGHSVFANALLRGLREMDQPLFTAGELFFNFIMIPVAGKSDQTPEYNPLYNSGHDGGDFIFIRRKSSQ